MKSMKRFGSIALSAVTAVSLFAGCKDDKKKQNYDTETRAMVFATDALDGNFNPFFATSATDTKIAAITQVGMLTTDSKGNPLVGENEPTVALAYKQTMKDSNGDVTTDGEAASKANGGTTEYEFIIKNGNKLYYVKQAEEMMESLPALPESSEQKNNEQENIEQ